MAETCCHVVTTWPRASHLRSYIVGWTSRETVHGTTCVESVWSIVEFEKLVEHLVNLIEFELLFSRNRLEPRYTNIATTPNHCWGEQHIKPKDKTRRTKENKCQHGSSMTSGWPATVAPSEVVPPHTPHSGAPHTKQHLQEGVRRWWCCCRDMS